MRDVIKKDRVQLVGANERRCVGRKAGEASMNGTALPAVRLLDLGSGSQAIEYTCACGEVSLLEVELAARQTARSSP